VLKKDNRLQKEKDFSRIFKSSRPVYSKNLVLRVSFLRDVSQAPKFGFIISNKLNKLATGRNALKRQLREIIKQALPNLKTGFNAVIMVKQDFEKPYDQKVIREQAEELLKKAKLFKMTKP
jgi:ribonuclease P protein component